MAGGAGSNVLSVLDADGQTMNTPLSLDGVDHNHPRVIRVRHPSASFDSDPGLALCGLYYYSSKYYVMNLEFIYSHVDGDGRSLEVTIKSVTIVESPYPFKKPEHVADGDGSLVISTVSPAGQSVTNVTYPHPIIGPAK